MDGNDGIKRLSDDLGNSDNLDFNGILAFLGWFALAPLALDVANSMEICVNQLFPPATNPRRQAFLKFTNLKTGSKHCRYGQLKTGDKITDCNPTPNPANAKPAELEIYDPSVLGMCVCTGGTKCKSTLADTGFASVASTIVVRVSLGTWIERLVP